MADADLAAPLEIEEGPARKLPNMNEFSPGVLDDNNVRRLLKLLEPLQGDKPSMTSAIIAKYPRIKKTEPEDQRIARANNVLIGMSQCGLLEKDGEDVAPTFTELAKEIAALPDDSQANGRFARHLLENCHGLQLIDVVGMIRARGEAVTLQAIRDELRARGYVVTENEGNSSKIRKWLESTGAVDDAWNIDDTKLHALTGTRSSVLAKWNGLSRAQRAFLENARYQSVHHAGGWMPVRHIKKVTESKHSRTIFPEGRLRAEVIDPLVADGWLEAKGTGGGRGGDSGDVKALPQLTDLKIQLPLDGVSGIPADLRDKLSVPLEQIFKDLESPITGIKGLALELLALRFTRDIGLFPVAFRERSAKTHGAEVDLIANGVHLHYSRWLLQCKNTAKVDVHDIAKEVGMAVVLKAHVIVLVTTGRFTRAVRTFADGLAGSSAQQAILIDKDLLKKYREAGAQSILEWLGTYARHVLVLKESQVTEIDE
jgi:hypothetical protein